MSLLRMVLGTALAILLAAIGMGGLFHDTPLGERLILCAVVEGPGFLVGGFALAYLIDVLEAGSTGPWATRLAALLLGVAFGAANILLATFVGGVLLGPFGILATAGLLPGAALAGGVGLGLGAQIGIRGGPE